MTILPNPFISNSAVYVSAAECSVAVSKPLIPMSETAATNDISEIFCLVHQLCAGARRFAPDYEAIWNAMHDNNAPRMRAGDPIWADASPLFLRGSV